MVGRARFADCQTLTKRGPESGLQMEIRIRLGQQTLRPMSKVEVVAPVKLVLITSGFVATTYPV